VCFCCGSSPRRPPGWYRNILVNPAVEIQVGTRKMQARPRIAAGEERVRLWQQAVEI